MHILKCIQKRSCALLAHDKCVLGVSNSGIPIFCGHERLVVFMKCPFCEFDDSSVIDSRPTDEGVSIRRRRECKQCNKRFTTYEKIENVPLIVVKKDKTRQAFDRQKLLNGLVRACEKRPVALASLEKIVDEIEAALYNSLDREIFTTVIGEMVMDKLKTVDEVAYVRFASVYRQFKDINTFRDELNKLLQEK